MPENPNQNQNPNQKQPDQRQPQSQPQRKEGTDKEPMREDRGANRDPDQRERKGQGI